MCCCVYPSILGTLCEIVALMLLSERDRDRKNREIERISVGKGRMDAESGRRTDDVESMEYTGVKHRKERRRWDSFSPLR